MWSLTLLCLYQWAFLKNDSNDFVIVFFRAAQYGQKVMLQLQKFDRSCDIIHWLIDDYILHYNFLLSLKKTVK